MPCGRSGSARSSRALRSASFSSRSGGWSLRLRQDSWPAGSTRSRASGRTSRATRSTASWPLQCPRRPPSQQPSSLPSDARGCGSARPPSPPLCLLAALALGRIRTPSLAWATAAVLGVPALAFLGGLVRASDYRADRMVKYMLGFENDERIARYARAHTSPHDSVYALVSRADFYFLADRTAASPYLWAHPLNTIPGARAALARVLAAPRRPRLVVLFQQAPLHGKEKRLRAILDRDYAAVWRAPGTGTTVLGRKPLPG